MTSVLEPVAAAPARQRQPLCITMHPADNVAIVANDGGLPAGTLFASGLTLVDKARPDGPQRRPIADGTATIEEVGWEMFRLLLDVASGRKKTWAEHWKLHNALVLFNPAPVT